MKNKVRPIDANALAKRIREYMDNFPYAGTRLATCRVVLSMLGDEGQTPTVKCDHNATEMRPNLNKPLTLEQLREMDGQPVWVERIGSDSQEDKEWALVFCKEKFCRTSCGNIALFGCYGIGWLAYAYPPAHIDREAWEPCGFCDTRNHPSCPSCQYIGRSLDDTPCCDCSPSGKCGKSYYEPSAFCSHCGRPLTEEAWAELEKRMGVLSVETSHENGHK